MHRRANLDPIQAQGKLWDSLVPLATPMPYRDLALPSHSTRQTLARQWAILTLLPEAGPGLNARVLQQLLLGVGHDTSKRTVERDLLELSKVFPLRCEDHTLPYSWSWQIGCKPASTGSVELAAVPDACPSTVIEPRHVRIIFKAGLRLTQDFAQTFGVSDLTLEPTSEGEVLACATLEDTPMLLNWLLSQAGALHVQAPVALREAMLARLRKGLELHERRASSPRQQ